MSMSPDDPATGTPASASAHRSRWRRFSPSMGWRAFWSEIVIVVLGIVIALAANAVVEAWNWRAKVRDAETRLQGDVMWSFLWAAEKYASRPCVEAQLAALARKVTGSGDKLEPTQAIAGSSGLQYVVRMPHRPYRFPTWEALVADGTANHFPPQRQAFFGRVSDSMSGSYAYEMETRGLQGKLLVMRDPITLDPAVRAELLTRINQLRAILSFETLNAAQRMRTIADAGSAPPERVVALFLNATGRREPGAAYSGMTQACKERGLPVADWRNYRNVSVSSTFDPHAGMDK